jgi:C-terminal processing protease CtpA/Prc
LKALAVLLLLACGVPCAAQLTDRQQKNMIAFTRLYGYVRYFHPSDEAAGLDWDHFARYGAGQVLQATSDDALIDTLQALFSPVAPTVQVFRTDQPPAAPVVTPADTTGYKVTAWQHLGWGLGSNRIYQSIRINRPAPPRPGAMSQSGVGIIKQGIPAPPVLWGKRVRFSGWMRVVAGTGSAGQFWFRVDKTKGSGFFYNMSDRPVTDSHWQEYSFTAIVDSGATQLVFGAFLRGEGQLWMDDIHISIQTDTGWSDLPLKNPGFEQGLEGWDYNKNQRDFSYTTDRSSARVGTYALEVASRANAQEDASLVTEPLFDGHPRPGDYTRSVLVPGISCVVPLALYTTRAHTYPYSALESELLQRMDIDKTLPNGDSLLTRLGDVTIAWNILRHFFPYWQDAAIQPGDLLTAILERAATDRTASDFKRTLRWMLAELNDGHMNVSLTGDTTFGTYYPPFQVVRAEHRIVVKRLLDSSLKSLLAPGDRVLSIDGVDADTALARNAGIFSGSPQWKETLGLMFLLRGQHNTPLSLQVDRGGPPQPVTCPRSVLVSTYLSPEYETPSGWIKPGIFYMNLSRDSIKFIKEWMPQLEKAKAIIADLRGYPTDNYSFLTYLLKAKDTTRWMFRPQIQYPDYQNVTYNGIGWYLTPQKPHLEAHIYYLTGAHAISYAESCMGYVKDFHLATIVGQPTAGTNGDIDPFSLPGGYYLIFTGMQVRNHDGSRHHLIGIQPDVLVEPTIEGIRNGRDEVLDKAVGLAEAQ